MINNWREIQERFDAIKDHKPRAAKKLNEIGEILSSAYAYDPDRANDMWQYIVDLNVSDNIAFSKFYIAQVFNKLAQHMEPEDVTALLSMNPNRLQLMIMHGYDGGGLWRCLGVLIRGYIILDDIDGATTCAGYFYDKFRGVDDENPDIVAVARLIAYICVEYIDNREHSDTALELLTIIGDSGNDRIDGYVKLIRTLNGIGEPTDYGTLFDIVKKVKCSEEFIDLLWLARDAYTKDELTNQWIEYVRCCNDDEIPRVKYINDDATNYRDSKLRFYVDLAKEADELLSYYFNRNRLDNVESGVIWEWIEHNDWSRFTKYVAKAILAIDGDSFERSAIGIDLSYYMSSAFSHTDCIFDGYKRSIAELMKNKGDDLVKALAKISALTIDSNIHESYHEYIKDFIQKTYGNLDVLKAEGFEDEVETRTAKERLKDYIHKFNESGRPYDERNTRYSLIIDALRDEMRDLGMSDSRIDRKLRYYYNLACDDEIAEFYCQHFPDEYKVRTDMISACVKEGNISRATRLIDLMAGTKGNPGYEDLNGWGRQNMLTLMYLIDKYDYEYDYKKDSDAWDSDADITDKMRALVKLLVYRMLPYLSESAREELEAISLYKIDSECANQDAYVKQLMEDLEIYTAVSRPHGKGNAQNINRISREFRTCFNRLSRMRRLDVVAEIMTRFAAVKDTLRPIAYDNWMYSMAEGLRNGDLAELYYSHKSIFEEWLDCDGLTDYDVLRVAEQFAKKSAENEFADFRKLIVKKKGRVEGLNSCYKLYGKERW